jgi:phenylacetate-CoA ligase
MKYDVSVVAPCFNEEKNIPELVQRLNNVFERKNLRGQIVLVNDGSRDSTGTVIETLAAEYNNIVGVHHETNKGIEQAWKSGVNRADGSLVCLIDADMQNLPEDVWRMYREITISNVDVVQGYRSAIGRQRDSRYYFSIGLIVLINLLFNTRLRDPKSGFVIARKDTMQNILRHRLRYQYFQTFIAVSALSKGYTVREIETLFENRMAGKSFMSDLPLFLIMKALVDIVVAFYEFRLSQKQDNVVAEFLETHRPEKQDEPLRGWRKFWWNLYTSTMPMHKWLITKRARMYYDELKESQWLKPAEIAELQEKKLRLLIQHAYRHVAHWRQVMDENGLHPDDIRTIEDLQKLPLLSKKTVRENLYFDMLSDNHDKSRILRISTSGSTGEPFVCFADQHQLEIRWGATQRSLEWTGYRFGDRCARLWHQTIGMNAVQIAKEAIDAWFCRRIFVPAFEMSDESIARFVKRLKAYKPVLIDGYAESFNFLALYMRNNKLEGLHPKGIVSSAQYLPDQSRRIIEENFKCGVYDKYGSREFSGIAYECEFHQGHHIVAESYIVEIIKDGRPAEPGELGEIVVTDLNNYCMPLIRYRLGDLGIAMDNSEACPCGRGLPRVGRIEGRTQAIVLGANGTYMPSSFFLHLFKDFTHIMRQFQIIQEEKGAIKLKLIKAPRFEDETFEQLLALLRQYVGQNMKIDVEFVDNIPLGRTGKHQSVISKLGVDFQQLDAEQVQSAESDVEPERAHR